MQVQVFRNAAEMLGSKVIKIDLTAVVADSEGKALAGKKVRFLLDDKVVAEAVTSESGEARTASVLVELPEHHGTTITAIPEGYAIRGQIDFADILGRKQPASTRSFTQVQATPEAPKYETPQGLDPVKNRILYHLMLGFAGAVIAIQVLMLFFLLGESSSGTIDAFNFLTGLSLIGVIAVDSVLIYRHWESLQVTSVTITPGQAVGFLFIPFFNLYWVFIAVYKMAQEYNRLIREHGIPATPAPESAAMTACILFCLAVVSFGALGFMAIIAMTLFLMHLRKTAEAVYLARVNEQTA